jgi:hypothetical protein
MQYASPSQSVAPAPRGPATDIAPVLVLIVTSLVPEA